ncbi:MAG: response regulator [Myxococcota bacterium]|jgi:signal transduction histidine kinase|nr:response regulator [Myxococcota bacterium]
MGEPPPQSIDERREGVERGVARLVVVRDRLVFVARDGMVLFVGDALADAEGVPPVGVAFDAWSSSASVELVDVHAAKYVDAVLSLLAAAPRSVLRVGGASETEPGPEWFEWTVLGPIGDEPGTAFLVSDVTRAWTGLSELASGEHVRRRLEERVLGSQKLESLGVLAGRVAHDFNNLLTPIVGNVGLALLDLPAESPLRKRAMAIKDAANRATALTRQLLNYAGQDLPSADAVNLSQAVEEMRLLLEAFAQSNTKLASALASDVPWIEVDASHVGQLVMNLVVNASEALQPQGGTIELRTGFVELDAEDLDRCVIGSDAQPGRFAYIEVADAGSGIPEIDRDRIFDPLFSTRAAGRGLGLTAVAEIVRGYDGALELSSEPGDGTRVRVLFPTTSPEAPMGRAGQVASESGSLSAALGPRATRGTVLVVDDDANARGLMAEVLGNAGFAVREAATGPVALRAFERADVTIDAVVLDYAMPLVTGAELFDAMRKLRSEVRAIMVSGYAPPDAAQDLMRRGLEGYVQKPFEPDELVAAVEAALE